MSNYCPIHHVILGIGLTSCPWCREEAPTSSPAPALDQLKALMVGLQIENQDLLLTKPPEFFLAIGETIAMACQDTAASRNAANRMVERIFAESIQEATIAVVPGSESPEGSPSGSEGSKSQSTPAGAREWTLVNSAGKPVAIDGPMLAPGERVRVREIVEGEGR